MLIEIDLQQYQNQLQIKHEQDNTYIFDPIRKNWLVLLPEELVRQLVLQHLLLTLDYKKTHIKTESGLKVNQLQKRSDLLCFDHDVKPYLLIECKAPQVKIQEAAFWQTVNYNQTLRAPYIVVTNGVRTFCCQMDYKEGQHQFLPTFPKAPF
ncbi:MAG: type I restriction enzyme HsdR N-terminal domain-containing protein [Saprospiraceae bacterium]